MRTKLKYYWLLTRTKRRGHICPVSQILHWLPFRFRIHYKVLLLTYKALNGPSYIGNFLVPFLWSFAASLLEVQGL